MRSTEFINKFAVTVEAAIAMKKAHKKPRINEFAPGGGGNSGDYLRALASAWYNGVFDTGSLPRGIKTQEDVERLLNRGIVCPDGKTRKLHIDYNSDFDGVEIYSDDYYEHGDLDGNDGRTGQPWGPYDHMEFKDEELDEGVTEADAAPGSKGYRVTWIEAGQKSTTGLLMKSGALEIAKKLQTKPGASDVKVVPYRDVSEGAGNIEVGDKITWWYNKFHPNYEGIVRKVVGNTIDVYAPGSGQMYRLTKDDIRSHEKKGVAEGEREKNPFEKGSMGHALWRDLSRTKKASPAQQQRNRERFAQRDAEKAKQQGVEEGESHDSALKAKKYFYSGDKKSAGSRNYSNDAGDSYELHAGGPWSHSKSGAKGKDLASLKQHLQGVAEDDAGDVEQRMTAKIAKEKQRLAKLKQTDPEAYKREIAKRKTSSGVPPVSTFEDQGVAEGGENWIKLPNGNYRNTHTGVTASKPPAQKKRQRKKPDLDNHPDNPKNWGGDKDDYIAWNAKHGVAEGHADQQRKILKKNGKPVGEVGIDRESSPGVGQWYMKCYVNGIDNSGYDSMEEAVADLKHLVNQVKTEGLNEFTTLDPAVDNSVTPEREKDVDVIFFGRLPQDWRAEDGWAALEEVLPTEYPPGSEKAQHKVHEVVRNGGAVITTKPLSVAKKLVSTFNTYGIKARVNQGTAEAANPAQQAAIAINMKKAGKRPMNEYNAEYDDEAGMAHTNLVTIARAAQGLLDTIDPHENLPEWVQEKIAKVEGMLVKTWNYLKSQEAQGIDPRVTEMYQGINESWQDMRHQVELNSEFNLIENFVNGLAARYRISTDYVWEDLETLTDDELYVFAATSDVVMEDWQKANKRDKTDGMSQKAVNAYRREHPGSKLKTAVTTKPSKLKKGSKASKRRKSYCSRSRGQMKMHNISCAKTPDKAICKARRRWNC